MLIVQYTEANPVSEFNENNCVLVETNRDGITEIMLSPVPSYKVDWTLLSHGQCPYCGQDGIKYKEQYCPECLGVFDLTLGSHYVLSHMIKIEPPK